MNKQEANKKAKEIFVQWQEKQEQIETEAKESGVWNLYGLDSNSSLFRNADDEAKKKLKKLFNLVDES